MPFSELAKKVVGTSKANTANYTMRRNLRYRSLEAKDQLERNIEEHGC